MAQQECDPGVQPRGRWVCSNVFHGRGRQLASMPEPHREPRKRAPPAARPPGRRRRRPRSWWRRAAIRRRLLPGIGTRPCPAAGLRQGRPGRSWVPPHQRDGRMWDCSEAWPPRSALTDRAARRGGPARARVQELAAEGGERLPEHGSTAGWGSAASGEGQIAAARCGLLHRAPLLTGPCMGAASLGHLGAPAPRDRAVLAPDHACQRANDMSGLATTTLRPAGWRAQAPRRLSARRCVIIRAAWSSPFDSWAANQPPGERGSFGRRGVVPLTPLRARPSKEGHADHGLHVSAPPQRPPATHSRRPAAAAACGPPPSLQSNGSAACLPWRSCRPWTTRSPSMMHGALVVAVALQRGAAPQLPVRFGRDSHD